MGPAARWGLPPAKIEPVLALLEARGQLVRGELRPGGVAHRQLRSRGAPPAPPPHAREAARAGRAGRRGDATPRSCRAGTASINRAAVRSRCAMRSPGSKASRCRSPSSSSGSCPRGSSTTTRACSTSSAPPASSCGSAPARSARKDGRVDAAPPRSRARARTRAAADREPRPAARRDRRAPAHRRRVVPRRGSSKRRTRAARATSIAALWDLVWAGLVTNDTFAPLRSLARAERAPRESRTRRSAAAGRSSNRSAPTPTATARARAGDRAARALGHRRRARARAPTTLPGGFAAVGDVLRAMEDAGTVRRGYFVESLEGAQFAWPGAIDRLREAPRGQAQRVDVLAAVDPANAWGSALPWPQLAIRMRKPARRSRCDRDPRRWRARACGSSRRASGSRPRPAAAPRRSSSRSRSGCRSSRSKQRRRELLIETIDGQPAGDRRWRAGPARGRRADRLSRPRRARP